MKSNLLFSLFILLLATTSFAQCRKKSIDTNYMDRSVSPKVDFFKYANGNWVKNNPVPKTESRWGSMNELDIANKKKLIGLLETARQSKTTSKSALIGAYYSSFVDTANRNKVGILPIKKLIDSIQSINSRDQLTSVLAQLHEQRIPALFSIEVGQDLKNVHANSFYIYQSGIGLPNASYYLQENKKSLVNHYQEFIKNLFLEIGYSSSKADEAAYHAVNFEKRLAAKMMLPQELRDPDKTYNKFTGADINDRLQDLEFESYLKKLNYPKVDKFIVGQPNYLFFIPELASTVPLEHWKEYLISQVLNHYASHLSTSFQKLNFNFYSVTLSGKTAERPLVEKAVNEITELPIGELLGELFVEKYFSASAQKKINTMVDHLTEAYKDRISHLTWMSDSTKKQAITKLVSIKRKLGFPSKWEDFSSLKFNATAYLENYIACEVWKFRKNLSEFDKPIDPSKWEMPPHMVNAYYQPLLNEIVFPAGIMQAPFFDLHAEDAVNYSRIGMIIGHELTHGFDDMGSKFSADGSFSNWWNDEDLKKFTSKTQILGQTYAAFCPIDGHCVNPELTMGENIADLGGLILAFNAYKKTREFKKQKKIYNFTPSQRFFISAAQIFKINFTEQELKNRLANDSHSPGMFRVNGTLKNCTDFFDAFDLKDGDPMRNSKDKLVEIW
jgi:putative endopeptidase